MPESFGPIQALEQSHTHPLFVELDALHSELRLEIDFGFEVLRDLLVAALAAHQRGELAFAKKLLNKALDTEHELTGDCAKLGPLAEAWGVDPETDR